MNRRSVARVVSSIALLFGTVALAPPAHATVSGNNGRLAFRRYLNNAHKSWGDLHDQPQRHR